MPILTELSGAVTVCSLAARAECPPVAGPEACSAPPGCHTPNNWRQQGIHGRAKTRRRIAHQGRFDRLGTCLRSDHHARQRDVAARMVGYSKEHRVRIAAAHPEDPADLGFIATVVLHDVQNAGHAHGRGSGPIYQSVNDFAALGIVNGFQRGLGTRQRMHSLPRRISPRTKDTENRL